MRWIIAIGAILIALEWLGFKVGWPPFLDWTVIAIPAIVGIVAWVIPMKEAQAIHKWMLTLGCITFSALLYLQQHLTRQEHASEIANLPTKTDIEKLPDLIVLRLQKVQIKETKTEHGKAIPTKVKSEPAAKNATPVQDIHRPQQELIASIIRSGIPQNEPIAVFADTTPEQLDTFARKMTAALLMGGMKAELGTSNHLRPGIVIMYSAEKKNYADVILDAFVKARVPGPITMQPGSPPQPLTIVISSTD